MSSQLQPQWDIGNSTFSLADRLMSLVKAATVDDVQPLAVFAAEAVGSCVEIDPHLIGRASDALGASDSFRLEGVKLSLGLHSGGIAREIRQSTAATKTFILIAALRSHLDIGAIAEFLYEMLIHSGHHERSPTSIMQLKGLCRALEAFCNKFDEAESRESNIWEQLLTPLAGISAKPFWQTLSAEEGARLLLEIFRSLRDDDLSAISIKGACGGAWITALLCQLLPGRVELLDGEKKQLFPASSAQSRISIVLDVSCHETWMIERFYKIHHIADIVSINPPAESPWGRMGIRPFSSYVPIQMVYQFLRAKYTSWNHSTMRLVKMISLSLLLAAMECNLVKNQNVCKFRSICRPDFDEILAAAFTSLGWPEDHSDDGMALELSERFLRSSPGRKESIFSLAQFRLCNEPWYYPASTMASQNDIWTTVVLLVQHILLQNFCQTPSSIRADVAHDQLIEAETGLLQLIQSNPKKINQGRPQMPSLSPSGLLRMIWAYFYTERPIILRPEDILAISARGFVTYLGCLVDVPTTPSEAFSILVIPGSLHWRNEPYKALISDASALLPNGSDIGPRKEIISLETNTVSPLLRKPSQPQQFVIQADVNTGILRWYCPQTAYGDMNILYSKAISRFVCALRVTPSTGSTEKEMEACRAVGITEVGCIYTGSDAILDEDRGIVRSCSGDPLADFLRFGAQNLKSRNAIIQGQASLRRCVVEAERTYQGKKWIIMASP